MCSLRIGFGIGMVICLMVGGTAEAGVLYGVGPYSTGTGLYTIDTDTGAATLIGATGVTKLAGLSFDADGALYAERAAYPLRLYVLDLATGAATELGNASTYTYEGDLAFDPTNGNLYVCEGIDADLLLVDPDTMDYGGVGDSGLASGDVSGLDFSADGVLYGYATMQTGVEDLLVTIDTATGLATTVGPMGFDNPGAFGGLAFDTSDDTLYQTDGSNLYTVDVATGAATLVGSLGVDEMAGLAYIPEPGTLGLLGLGGLAVLRRRR